MNLKNKILLLFLQTNKKRKEVSHKVMSRDHAQKMKNFPSMKKSRDNDQKKLYMGNEMQLQNRSSTTFYKNKSLLSTSSILHRSPMAHNTATSLDKLICTDYNDFGKCRDGYGQFSWSENDADYLDVKLKVFKKGGNKEFWLVRKLTMGEADFYQLMR